MANLQASAQGIAKYVEIDFAEVRNLSCFSLLACLLIHYGLESFAEIDLIFF